MVPMMPYSCAPIYSGLSTQCQGGLDQQEHMAPGSHCWANFKRRVLIHSHEDATLPHTQNSFLHRFFASLPVEEASCPSPWSPLTLSPSLGSTFLKHTGICGPTQVKSCPHKHLSLSLSHTPHINMPTFSHTLTLTHTSHIHTTHVPFSSQTSSSPCASSWANRWF